MLFFVMHLEKGNKHLATFYSMREKKQAIVQLLSGRTCTVAFESDFGKLNAV